MNPFEQGMNKLLVSQLANLYFCENQLIGALLRMAEAAQDPHLKDALNEHRQQTIGHVHRLEAAFVELKETPRAFPCRALDGLLDDTKWTIQRLKGDPTLDWALTSAAQKVELFEVASYRSAVRLARQLGNEKVAVLCEGILDEELVADRKFAGLAFFGEREVVQ